MINLPPVILQNFPAYLDPGTGSLIIQILVASFLGGLFMLKVYWKKVKAWFKRNKDDK